MPVVQVTKANFCCLYQSLRKLDLRSADGGRKRISSLIQGQKSDCGYYGGRKRNPIYYPDTSHQNQNLGNPKHRWSGPKDRSLRRLMASDLLITSAVIRYMEEGVVEDRTNFCADGGSHSRKCLLANLSGESAGRDTEAHTSRQLQSLCPRYREKHDCT